MDVSNSSLVNELREQIEGKNELIAALVVELEQVAEQLDRVKRNGVDRARPGSTAVLPAELVEEHQQVLGDLQRAIEKLEEMQTAAALGRIESEIADLRTMFANSSLHRPFDDDTARISAASFAPVMSRSETENAGADSSTGSSSTAWESMKREILGEPPECKNAGENGVDLSNVLDGIPVPVPIDFDAVSVETLKRACAERDTYIVQITRWVRTQRSVSLPENWDEIQGVPEDLRQQVEHVSMRLEEQVRLAEVEMSLERARMSREKSQLQADRAIMEKHLKRLGIASLDELDDISVSSTSSADRRWMRFLGVNRK